MAFRQPPGSSGEDRGKSRNFKALSVLLRYLKPYRLQMVGASVALVVAASMVLGLGGGLRYLVDKGFAQGEAGLLDQAVLVLLAVVGLMAVATYARYSLVSWLGERVVADIRRDVFDHVITLDPGFFEVVRTGEIVSRLTTDTSVIQVVVGSSV